MLRISDALRIVGLDRLVRRPKARNLAEKVLAKVCSRDGQDLPVPDRPIKEGP